MWPPHIPDLLTHLNKHIMFKIKRSEVLLKIESDFQNKWGKNSCNILDNEMCYKPVL